MINVSVYHPRLLHLGILLLFAVLFSLASMSSAKTPPVISSGDHLWLATEYGLYRYNKAQDEWSVFSSENGLAGNNVRDMGIDEGIIWVATDGGVSNSDVRFSDWRYYRIEDGLPSDDVRCIAFSQDYVWIGTDSGAARFDKFLDEWEIYTEANGLIGDQVNDIAVDGEIVWFATSNGVSRYDIEFDKWTNYNTEAELPSINVTWAMIAGEYVWFVTDEGLARYDKQLRSWKLYGMIDGIVSYIINDVAIDGNNIWLATPDGISSYDFLSDSWSVGTIYHNMLPSRNVMDLAIDGDLKWFCTDRGVSRYDRKTGSWRTFTTADGLLDNDGRTITVSGQVFVVTEKGVNLYDKSLQEWRTYEFSGQIPEDAGVDSGQRGLRLDDQGIGYDLAQEAQVRLSGLSSVERSDVISLRPEREHEYEWDTENDLSLRGTIPGGRSVVGFYNDTDKDDIEYGVTYHGNDTDILQEATGGEFEAKMRNSDLIDDLNLLGGGARLRKSFNAVKLNIEPRYGLQRGHFETDFFIYRTDITIYRLSHRNIIPGTDEVEADNKKLQSGVDYLIVYPSGWLVFHREELLEEGEKIEVRYQYESDDETDDPYLGLLTTGVDLGNNYYAGFDVLHRDDLDLISLNGEGRNMDIGTVSMKLRPEIAYSRRQSDDHTAEGMASRGELIANASRAQFKAEYEAYGEDFWTIGRRETRFGNLERHYGAYSQVDIAQWMPLAAWWQRDRSSGDDMTITSEDDARMNLVLSRKPYPTFAVTGERNAVSSPELKETENAARADLQYDMPGSLLSYIGFRRAEFKGYYKEAYQKSMEDKARTRTGYARLLLNPLQQFVISTSYKINSAREKDSASEDYHLREELQRLLIRSDFASLDGIISTFHLEDLRLQSRSESGVLVKDVDRAISTGLNLLPGAWVKKLEMLTVAGTYSLFKQTVPVAEPASEDGESERADSNLTAVRFQANLRPHDMVLLTGTYDRGKNWIEGIPSITRSRKYRSEAEIKPSDKSRIVLEYYQENEDKDSASQERLYSPSLWWETGWSRSWTTRLRGIYNREILRESGEILETGSTLTPSLSFRYSARELPHNGRLYLTQSFSVSVYRGERSEEDLASETYSTSTISEWKITGNLSLRLRAGISYKNNSTQGESDEASASIYAKMLARF